MEMEVTFNLVHEMGGVWPNVAGLRRNFFFSRMILHVCVMQKCQHSTCSSGERK